MGDFECDRPLKVGVECSPDDTKSPLTDTLVESEPTQQFLAVTSCGRLRSIDPKQAPALRAHELARSIARGRQKLLAVRASQSGKIDCGVVSV
jgi:hypothetical protein